MRREDFCHSGAVSFSVESATPQPRMPCYGSICRIPGWHAKRGLLEP